ncbi:hypothetical protein HMPREF1531_00215 [Propionibacterium sp. oral taxon 192 str. F0372]|uniref:hypothetical protein n=1 Tax=Propionibacterium sp. oral taxon 192 TaxID=671222 RepID=UPI000354486E|nr:hypothetical protein [Propionibacterium sp. oral taxon 192]EPH07162.1 hypothetical protein HMPREF1531_00215 [Propionibacterium sp. oral taxon 192 str. F0372]
MASSSAPRFRSRAIITALIAWWSAVVLGAVGWRLIDAGLEGSDGLIRVGVWGLGLAALGAVIGWGASIGAVLNDVGRVRAGAWCLVAMPIVALLFGWAAISSAMIDPSKPLGGLWLVVSGILLFVATLLVIPPERLGH